jgi:hypothetical protein
MDDVRLMTLTALADGSSEPFVRKWAAAELLRYNENHDEHGRFSAGDGSGNLAKEPWQVPLKDYLDTQITGWIPSDAYDSYSTRKGLDWVDPKKYPEVIKTVDVRGTPVTIQRDREPMQYTKTDANDDIVRGPDGLAEHLSTAEAVAAGLPTETANLVAVDSKGVVGFASDEFGATGVWVVEEMQRGGLGKTLLQEFHQLNPRLAARPIGQATEAGRNLVASYHKASVQTALTAGKPVPLSVLADYPDVKAKHG